MASVLSSARSLKNSSEPITDFPPHAGQPFVEKPGQRTRGRWRQALFIPERFNGIEPRRFIRGIESKKEPDGQGEHKRRQNSLD